MLRVVCQACRLETASQEIENDEDNCPYRLCENCAMRLDTRSLRPLEWMYLVAIHGPKKHELHDDFYTETGQACQPERKVRDAHIFPYPELDDIRENLFCLLDLAMSLWCLEICLDIIEALKHFPAEEILEELTRRNREYETSWVHDTSLDICARVLSEKAAVWVRNDNRSNLFKWAKAAAHCLPFDEGFSEVVKRLEEHPNAASATLLTDFHSSRVLDWIEAHQHWCNSTNVYQWGRTAAYCELSGERVRRWLKTEPTLSRIALTALLMIVNHPNYGQLRTYFHSPKLLDPGSWDSFLSDLADYEKQEDDPKTLGKIALIRESDAVKGLFRS